VSAARIARWAGASLLASGFVPSARSAVSFALHNLGKGAGISRDDLQMMLTACLRENDVSVPPSDIESVVEKTFASFDADGDGHISFDEYRVMVEADKTVLDPLTLNVPELIASAKADAAAAAASASSAAGTA